MRSEIISIILGVLAMLIAFYYAEKNRICEVVIACTIIICLMIGVKG